MARAGDTIDNPVTGERIVFRTTALESRGALLQFDFSLQPRGAVPVAHIHPSQEERITVVRGRVLVRQGRHARELGVGASVTIAPGTPHQVVNAGDDEAQLLVEFRPAGAAERFFEMFFGLCRDGKVKPSGQVSPYQAAVLMGETHFGYLAAPPIPLQRALFAVLRPIGRLRGDGARYRRYVREDGA